MIQCKLCGTPLKNDDDDTLLAHWKGQHSWHWEKGVDKMTAREAIIKQR